MTTVVPRGQLRPLVSTTDITIFDPRSGERVGAVAQADRDDVARAVLEARHAFPAWSATPPAERGALLHRLADALVAEVDELSELNARETGKLLADARGGVLAGAATLRQYAEIGPLHRGSSLLGHGSAADWTTPEPYGVVAVITPWNDPVAVACGLIGAALVMGNTVVHKPSERCPHLGIRLGELLADALPAGVMQTVSGDGGVGSVLTEQEGVDVFAHVGSSLTGLKIARVAALTGAHVVRENGGNDALIVDDDVDPAWAAEQAALGAFANAGQICTSVERIYVVRAIADEFTDALVREAGRWNDQGRLGPLVDERLRSEVDRQVQLALEDGAEALVGGEIPGGPGSWYPATVLRNCRSSMDIMTEETFGPVAPITVVDSFDDALEAAARDRYGLAATVLTGSLEHANGAVRRLPVGTVKVNAVFGGAPGGSAQPRKASGSGFGYGPELLDEMSLTKVVHQGLPVLRKAVS